MLEVVEYGFDLLKRCLCFAHKIQKTCFLAKTAGCNRSLNLTYIQFTNNGWSLRLLEKTWQQFGFCE